MAKHVIVAHRAPFMRRLLMSALEKLGYEAIEQHPPKPDEQWAKKDSGLAMPMRWEDTARLYDRYRAAAVIVDPVDGPELIRDLMKRRPDIVVIGCGTELNPDVQSTWSSPPSVREKELLDAGAKATAVLRPSDPGPELKAALSRAAR